LLGPSLLPLLFSPVPLPQLLEDIGALNEQEHLTSLGRHLAALPLPPALGKMLLYGVLFSCLDPILTVACCMAYRWVLVGAGGWVGVGGWPGGWVGGWVGAACGLLHAPQISFPATYTNAMHCLPGCPPGCLRACRDPWVLPAAADARRQATLTRARLSSDAGGASDHLAAIKAYNQWKGASAVSGWPRTSSCWLPAAVAAWAAWAAWRQEQALFWQQRSVQCLDYNSPACRWLMDRLLPCPAPLYRALPPCLPAARR
jgi:hypothetical protein